jgi:hypothetical protein
MVPCPRVKYSAFRLQVRSFALLARFISVVCVKDIGKQHILTELQANKSGVEEIWRSVGLIV